MTTEIAWKRVAKAKSTEVNSDRHSSSSQVSSSFTISSKVVEVKNAVRLTIRKSYATILPINEVAKSKENINDARDIVNETNGLPTSRSFMDFFAPKYDSDNDSFHSFSSLDSSFINRQKIYPSSTKALFEAMTVPESHAKVTQDERIKRNDSIKQERYLSKRKERYCDDLGVEEQINKSPSDEWIHHIDCSLSFLSSSSSSSSIWSAYSNHLGSFLQIRREEFDRLSMIFRAAESSSKPCMVVVMLRRIKRWLVRLYKRCLRRCSKDSAMEQSHTTLPSQPSSGSIGYHDMLYITNVLLQQAKVHEA